MKKTIISESLKYHLENDIQITENLFRHGSESYFNLITQVRNLYDSEDVELNGIDRELYETTDIGIWDEYGNEIVPLDLPIEHVEFLTEAEYQGKEVKLSYPMSG